MERRGTIESAFRALGVSRATLFNWFGRDRPPPGEKMQAKLREFLGGETDFVFDGRLDAPVQTVQETAAQYGGTDDQAARLRISIRTIFERAIGLAGEDLGRLGWIREQLRTYLVPPPHWTAPGGDVAREEAFSRMIAEIEERAAQHVRATGSENNPAVIEAKNNGLRRGFAKAGEIISNQVPSASASSVKTTKTG